MRVLKILNVDDQIDGLVFCNYPEKNFSCKPERVFFDQVRLVCVIDQPLILILYRL